MADTSRQLVHELKYKGISINRPGTMSHEDAIQVTFVRTIRVSGNNTTNKLPPDLGKFPVFEASNYKGLPLEMLAKGGYFFPMRRTYLPYNQTAHLQHDHRA
jgi:hypothetical protein